MPESGSRAFFVVNLLMLQLRVFWVANVAFTRFFLSRISRLRAFWGGIFGRNLSEILRNTQNFGRNSEEKIGHWSLWVELLMAEPMLEDVVVEEDTSARMKLAGKLVQSLSPPWCQCLLGKVIYFLYEILHLFSCFCIL